MTMYLLGALVRAWRRLVRGGFRPSERRRQRSIAALAARHADPIPAADVALVDAHHDLVVQWRTGEQPIVPTVRRRTVVRRPARWQRIAVARRAARPARDFAADPLAAPITGPLARPALCASMPVWQPHPWETETFTQQWKTGELAALVAEAKDRELPGGTS